MVQAGSIFLSRYFNRNVDIIAGMCATCYKECDEVQIVAVNIKFLLKILNMSLKVTESSEKMNNSSHVDSDKPETSNDIALNNNNNNNLYFKGFSHDDMENSKIYVQNFIKISNDDEGNTSNISKYFRRFTRGKTGYENDSRDCRLIRFKIYQRNDIQSSGYNKFNKSTKVNESISYKTHVLNSSQSKYFSSANNNFKLKSTKKINKLQSELPETKVIENKREIKTCKLEYNPSIINFKDEPPDYFETEYFKMVKNETLGAVKLLDEKISIWIPPKSPHNLIEESLYHDPWALLVATIFLNRTKCMIARPYVFWFLKENPNPLCVLEKYPQELEKYFVNLGLQKTRAVQVWRMSNDYAYKKWTNVKELYGIGQYGETAFKMFCLGDFSIQPKDRFLKIYKAWYENIGRKMQHKCE